jgi:hypothetical protein
MDALSAIANVVLGGQAVLYAIKYLAYKYGGLPKLALYLPTPLDITYCLRNNAKASDGLEKICD